MSAPNDEDGTRTLTATIVVCRRVQSGEPRSVNVTVRDSLRPMHETIVHRVVPDKASEHVVAHISRVAAQDALREALNADVSTPETVTHRVLAENEVERRRDFIEDEMAKEDDADA